jgi:ankyrin repeat protein
MTNELELFKAIEGLNIEKVKELIQQGVNINKAKNKYRPKYTPIHTASICTYKEPVKISQSIALLQLLIDNGADVNLRNDDLETPLFESLFSSTSIIKILIENGAKINLQNIRGQTPLHLICGFNGCGKVDVLKLLLDNGADVFVKDFKRQTPLQLAMETEKSAIIELLLEYGAT